MSILGLALFALLRVQDSPQRVLGNLRGNGRLHTPTANANRRRSGGYRRRFLLLASSATMSSVGT